MKKVIVVSKTHLDLGFTDFASKIKNKYINEYIPGAIELAESLNTSECRKFIWTTGSWILKEALTKGSSTNREKLKKAIKDGNIVPHAMPFTTHTELLDYDTLDYGLSIVDSLDKLRGRKTTAAKMTDVPGHTKALVPLLAKHGIKLLHIGVNGASALCDVPPCFLWKCGDAEVVVIYSGDYGGAFKCGLIEEVLYFDHTLDNHGTPAPEKILSKLQHIEKEYPGYTVEAGSMDEFADIIWEKRNELPVVTDELGDTWIHGAASDPYKTAALRELINLKNEWLESGKLKRNSTEYLRFTDQLMCVAEHTWGMDMKTYLGDESLSFTERLRNFLSFMLHKIYSGENFAYTIFFFLSRRFLQSSAGERGSLGERPFAVPVTAFFKKAQESGEFPAKHSPELCCATLLSFIQGYTLNKVLMPESEEMLPGPNIDFMIDIFTK